MKKIVGIAGVVILLVCLGIGVVGAAWYDGDFSKKVPIKINNTGGGALAYYQVSLNITYDSDMNANFSDILVVNDTSGTTVPHWNESGVNGAYCNIWFNASAIPAGAWTNTTYYLYYGNPAAGSSSNGTNTWIFFDGAENNTVVSKFEYFEKYGSNPLTIPEYDADGATHPDVLYFTDGMDGYKYWMLYTPYPPDTVENPSILRSNDGITWVDTGITNPVIPLAGSDHHNADPDMIYVSDYGKWFMVWSGAVLDPDHKRIKFGYSADGKDWTLYDGIIINGNTNPAILSGNDDNGLAWERNAGELSRVVYPTLFYENGTFYLFYGMDETPNQSPVGLATFTWNNTTNDIENFSRYSPSPLFSPGATSYFASGVGHMDISYYDGTYYMYVMRKLASSANYELALFTSTSLTSTSWTDEGVVLERGTTGQWDAYHVYRASPVTTGEGTIVLFSDEVKLYYGGVSAANAWKIGFGTGMESSDYDFSDWPAWSGQSQIERSTNQSKSGSYSFMADANNQISEHILDESTNRRVLAWFYDVAGTESEALIIDAYDNVTSCSIGYNALQSTTKYVYRIGSTWNVTTIDRGTNAWHLFEWRFTTGNVKGFIDGTEIFSVSEPDTLSKLLQGTFWILPHNFYADDFCVGKYASPEPVAEELGAEEDAPVSYTPGDPANLQHTEGEYWVNYTWDAGVGNVTDSYNVSWNSTWHNNTLDTYMNMSVGAANWANITVWSFNGTNLGALSAGSVSDQVQLEDDHYVPENPDNLQNTNGDYWVNYTWDGGAGGNVTDSFNVSWNGTWYNGSAVPFRNMTIPDDGCANITVWSFNGTNLGALSAGSISDSVCFGAPPAATKVYYQFEPATVPVEFEKSEEFDNFTGNESWDNFTGLVETMYTEVMGSAFYLFLFGLPILMLWLRQDNIIMPAVFGMILGVVGFSYLPFEYRAISIIFLGLCIAGIVYGIFKSRR